MRRVLPAIAAAIALAPAFVHAQYPTKPVRMVTLVPGGEAKDE